MQNNQILARLMLYSIKNKCYNFLLKFTAKQNIFLCFLLKQNRYQYNYNFKEIK